MDQSLQYLAQQVDLISERQENPEFQDNPDYSKNLGSQESPNYSENPDYSKKSRISSIRTSVTNRNTKVQLVRRQYRQF